MSVSFSLTNSASAPSRPNPETPTTTTSKLESGRRTALVLLGSSWCKGSTDPRLRTAVQALKRAATGDSSSTSLIGVAVDWTVESGTEWLETLGEFDEMAVGGNWLSTGAFSYVWSRPSVRPELPQLLVVERDLQIDSDGVQLKAERVVSTAIGVDAILALAMQLERTQRPEAGRAR